MNVQIKETLKSRINPFLLRRFGVAPAPSTRFLMGQRMALFHNLRIDRVLDVGANTGQYGEELRRLGFRGWIDSFEPMAAAYLSLEQMAAPDDRWRCHLLALGAETATASLHAWSGSAGESSSLRTPTPALVGLLGSPTEEVVDLTTLDKWMDQHPERQGTRAWLKIDTQGFESEVLAGGQRALNQTLGVEIELPLRHWYEGSADLVALVGTLREAGFVPASIMTERFRTEWNGAIDVDALFVRSEEMSFSQR